MKLRNRIMVVVLMAVTMFTATSCLSGGQKAKDAAASIAAIDKDREGNPISVPESIERIISLGPSNSEILVALGFGDKIVAADTFSDNIEGINGDIPFFNMMAPDGEQIIVLEPDVIFVSGISRGGGDDPLKTVADTGVCVIYIPSSSSIQSIKEDIRFVAQVMGVPEKGEAVIVELEKEIDAVRAIGDAITDKKTVYFEVQAAPYMYSFGQGVYLNEMIEFIGAKNILGDLDGWLSITDEAILAANPDVILTCINYIDDPVAEIMSRPGWSEITAVANGDVYYIDTDASNRPNHNIVKALAEMAKCVYPDKY